MEASARQEWIASYLHDKLRECEGDREDRRSEELVPMALELARANSEIQECRNMNKHRLVQLHEMQTKYESQLVVLREALDNTPLRCLDALRKAQENNEALKKKLAEVEAENVLLKKNTELLKAERNMLLRQTQPSRPRKGGE